MRKFLLFFCILPLMVTPAIAGKLVIAWDSEFYNTDSLNCARTDTLSIASDMRGVRLWRVRFGVPNDTTYLGEFPFNADSILFVHPDSGFHYGEVLARGVDISGNVSCVAHHVLFVKPLPLPILPGPTEGSGLTGEYYTYTRWQDFKTLLGTRVDSTIAFDWGAGAGWPTGPPDYWSVKWIGKVVVPLDGMWTFYILSNDGSRLWIDNDQVQNNWGDKNSETSSTMFLSAGEHYINLEYYEGYSSAKCSLLWEGPSTPKQVIPKEYLLP